MYDPEGSLSTLPTVMNCWLGLHFGRVLKFDKIQGVRSRMIHWFTLATVLIGLGVIIHFAGIPMNKQLWSLSYLLFMSGTCGAALLVAYLMVDIEHSYTKHFKFILRPFEYMGMNAILVFFWHGLAEAILHSVYITTGSDPLTPGQERHNLLTFIHDQIIGNICNQNAKATQMIYVILKVFCFMGATWYLYKIKYFWKI
tara:strand:- start:57 stop:653 length:597 start_codon:yes stop_codon:yes gene_type:complete